MHIVSVKKTKSKENVSKCEFIGFIGKDLSELRIHSLGHKERIVHKSALIGPLKLFLGL